MEEKCKLTHHPELLLPQTPYLQKDNYTLKVVETSLITIQQHVDLVISSAGTNISIWLPLEAASGPEPMLPEIASCITDTTACTPGLHSCIAGSPAMADMIEPQSKPYLIDPNSCVSTDAIKN